MIERSESEAQLSAGQFDRIAETIVTNPAFRSWQDGTMINVSNCTISVSYPGGVRSPMSNVSEKTTDYSTMVAAIRELEQKLDWKTVK